MDDASPNPYFGPWAAEDGPQPAMQKTAQKTRRIGNPPTQNAKIEKYTLTL